MQVRLFVAVLLAFGLAIFVRLFWSVFRGIILGAWPNAWRNRREKNHTRAAIENLALSDWAAASKELVRLTNHADQPVPLIVLSAHAAEAQGDYEQATQTYEKVSEDFPEWSYVVRIRLCQIAIARGELDEAIDLLADLKNERKGDARLQLLDIQLAEEKRDWSQLEQGLLAVSKKPDTAALVAPIERRYFYGRLAERLTAPELVGLYKHASAAQSLPPGIITELAKQLAMRGHAKEAEALVRNAITRRWDERLVSVYAELEAKSPAKQLKNAESWLVSHSESDALIACLHKLAVRAGDDGKADHYTELFDQKKSADTESSTELPSP